MDSFQVHKIESLGALDGPGLRTVIFLQGCNMRCLYCHNRDSWDFSAGTNISFDEILSVILSNRPYFGAKGGVTFSGGEPLVQATALLKFIKVLKEQGIHITIDTSGSISSEKVEEIFDLADLVILDIKHAQSDRFLDLCGLSDEPVKKNLQYLQQKATDYWIRQVVLEGYTDSIDQIDRLKKLLSRGSLPQKVQLLPYHAMGQEKWESLEEEYVLAGVKPPTNELMDQLNMRLRN